ncbi:MAG: hypothetical protein JWO33_1037 [Caulobacteraceae bacterium]|nr:hypothetical protein [Caulobacteraceae bacterium]
MIYPTRKAVLLIAAGAPVALLIGLIAPGFWLAGPAWVVLLLTLTLADGWMGSPPSAARLTLAAPGSLYVGADAEARIDAAFDAGRPPALVEVALEANGRVDVQPERRLASVHGGEVRAPFLLTPRRRGEAELSHGWLRWRGPMGLVWKQRRQAFGHVAPVVPNIQAVREEAVRLFSRESLFGLKVQIDSGEGAEFHALTDFRAGMDRRSIDWKQSAKHAALIGKEYRTERNHHIVCAVDCGRLMSEPVAGLPRIDQAINASLLLAYVSLKIGDRVALFAFDDRPRQASGLVSGVRAFPLLQRLASKVDYSAEETNFTLGLTTLAGRLQRRSLVVVFTDFADTTSAELMVENVGRLLDRHLVLFVAFRDEELEALVEADPMEIDDVSRAVTAANLLKERELVLTTLRRMGVHVLDAPSARLGPAVLTAYLDLKRRNLL